MSALATPVLVLNKQWTAVRFVPAWQAFSYLVRGVAKVVDRDYTVYDFASWEDLSKYASEFEPEAHSFVQTVHSRLVVPAVVLLLAYSDKRRARIRLSRRNIYARDQNICQYCGHKFKTSELNLDHVMPRCQGGRSTADNLVCSCVKCNTRKAGRTPEQAGLQLIRPVQPLLVNADMKPVKHDTWKHFVDAAYWNVELED